MGELKMKKVQIWKWLPAACAAVTFALMLVVWPLHPFRTLSAIRSGDDGHVITPPIAIGESITQDFRAPQNNIVQLEFVLTFEEGQPREGELLFEFMDAAGEVLHQEMLQYSGISDYTYGGPVLNLRLKKGRMYSYRLTNLSISRNQPCGVYTTDLKEQCLKKGRLQVGATTMEGELLTRMKTNSPINAENTLAVWGCIGMVGFSVYELLRRLSREYTENLQIM